MHVRASGADFLGALRKAFSNTFCRRLVTCGAEEFQNRTGNPPPQAITEPPNLDNEALWRMRRDLEGCAPNQPAALLIPPMECTLGLTLLQLRSSGATVDGYYRSEEHTSELQSLMRISYAVFCLKKKNRYTARH